MMLYPTKILIVDDHEMIRDGLKHIIFEKFKDRDFIIYEAESIAGAKEMVLLHRPDVLLIDYRLKDGTGNNLILWLAATNMRIPALALSNYAETSCINEMLSAGAKGYLLKDIDSHELMKAIDAVLSGGVYTSEKLLHTSPSPLPQHLLSQHGITKREHEILQLMIDQHTTDEISKQLFLSKRTVETHRYRLLKKFNVKNSLSLLKTVLTHHH